ncbi:DUF5008 domain-containing protein [Niabella beijingensis]|uniref:DUF5008 domain-containing protein n=1 Tax=Niabella beijingensis TaxID=2872700 RepID=UPI001CBE9AA0|nr:DUF5008 domain-containing protein [Niabella beijingensis]MBZ4188303.1 DUF5008 domain-containing protein [Niabella beijingensis]
MMMHRNFYILCLSALVLTGLSACSRSADLYDDPYGGGKEVIEVDFINTPPTPANGQPGQQMTFAVKGLKPEMKDQLTFLANGMTATIAAYTDSSVTIVLPDNVSSGGASLRVGGQIFPGPSFTIRGKLQKDPSFNPGTGVKGITNQILQLPNGNFMLAGSIYGYQGKDQASGINGLVQIDPSGNLAGNFSPGSGPAGFINSVLRLPSGEFLIGGTMTTYDNVDGMNGLTVLNSNASIKTKIVSLYVSPNVSDPSMATDTVSWFNGNLTEGSISKLFYGNDQITAVGSFERYGTYFYERSTKDNKLFDYIPANQLVRMDTEGNLDSSYSYNKTTRQALPGANGSINDAFLQPDGKLIVVGDFTTLRGKPANRIARLNADGTLDAGFKTGAGADDVIYSIRYNAVSKKIILTGNFSRFNNQPAEKIVMLDELGQPDPAFKSAGFSGGLPTMALQLGNGLVVVTGSFTTYNNIVRNGLMVLNADGSLAAGYNATGKIDGTVTDMIETKSGIGGLPAVMLVGYISRFEGQPAGGILKLVFNN